MAAMPFPFNGHLLCLCLQYSSTLDVPDSIYAHFNIVSNTCHQAPYYLKSDKPFLTLSYRYRNPERDFELGSSSECLLEFDTRSKPLCFICFFSFLVIFRTVSHFPTTTTSFVSCEKSKKCCNFYITWEILLGAIRKCNRRLPDFRFWGLWL